jgi:hypothetical protein
MAKRITELSCRAYHFISKHNHSFERQFSVARAEKMFQAWPQHEHNKNIVVTLSTKPRDS